jgi:hypothetical protein
MYLRTFKARTTAGASVIGPRIPLPTVGPGEPHWRADGREILYVASDGNMMSLPIRLTDPASSGRPVALFKAPTTYRWDATSDAQRFLFAMPVGPQTIAPFTVVLNWQAGARTP